MSSQNDELKLTYLPAQARVRLVISKAACDRSPLPPEDMIQRAIARLDQGVKDGSLAFYNLYRDRLTLAWQRMRAARFKPDKRIAVTIAAGAPPLPEISISAGPVPFIASLSIDASPEKISSWKFEFLKLTVQQKLKDANIKGHPDPAMLQAIFLRALRGKRIVRMPLSAAPALPASGGDHFSVMPRGITGDLVLVINNISSVATQQGRQSIIDWLEKYVENASKRSSKHYLLLKEDVENRLKSFLRGPERLSIDLPAVILVALAEPKTQLNTDPVEGAQAAVDAQNQKAEAPTSAGPGAKPVPRPQNTILLNFDGNQFFKIETDANKMTATIHIVSDKIYKDPGALTTERLEAYLNSKGITFGIKSDAINELKAAVSEEKDIKNFEIAVGVWPQHPEDPYLHASYKDPKKHASGTNLRERQRGNFVKRGDLVAEIAFKKPGSSGTDIFGNTVPTTMPALPDITCVQNVELRDKMFFFATKDGLPQLSENSIGIEPAYIHEGNVNLSTGNIVFDGPVIITGNVEQGAFVSASGDLEIKGVIEECVVKCGGNLTAAGIISGPRGFIKVGGSATVSFINNARMEVRSDLSVEGNITNSKILVGKSLSVLTDTSLIIGGAIDFGETIKCAHLGKASGQITAVSGGLNPFLNRKLATLTKRVERLQLMKEEIKKSSRHLSGIKAQSATKKHASRRENLKEAQVHISSLITRTTTQIDDLKLKLEPFNETRIEVKGILSQNCKISLGGKNIINQGDVSEVAVVTKRVKGSFIVPLEGQAASDGQKSA